MNIQTKFSLGDEVYFYNDKANCLVQRIVTGVTVIVEKNTNLLSAERERASIVYKLNIDYGNGVWGEQDLFKTKEDFFDTVKTENYKR